MGSPAPFYTNNIYIKSSQALCQLYSNISKSQNENLYKSKVDLFLIKQIEFEILQMPSIDQKTFCSK